MLDAPADIKPAWILHVPYKYWTVLLQTLALATEYVMNILNNIPFDALRDMGLPSFLIHTMDAEEMCLYQDVFRSLSIA